MLALRSTEPDGICTSTAMYFTEQPALPLLEMYMKCITFVTGRVHARPAIPHVLQLAAEAKLQPERVTSREVAWDDAAAALLERDWVKLVFRALVELRARPASGEPLLRTALRDDPNGF